ncbi:MAG: hypothetical protein ABR867_06580, partial [Nitrososphaerales archaeon]
MPSLESILLKVFIVVVVICAVIIAFLFIPRFFPSPATITPSIVSVDKGQQVSIGVGWKGGSAPYTVTLYGSSGTSCTSSSTVIGAPKSGLSQPQYVFTILPTSTMRYCGTVSSSSKSSSMSSSVVVTVNPALVAPSLVLSPSAMDVGQNSTVTAVATAKGGTAPYTFTLRSGTSNACSADKTVVKVSAGKNPINGLAGKIAQFSFVAPTADTFYCVTVVNSATASPSTSAAVEFTINPALTVSISHASQKIDSGQSVSLSATASQGTPPYTYQWNSDAACAQPIAGQNKSSFSTGALTSTGSYSVAVGDSSTAVPAASICLKAAITVSPALKGTSVSIGPSVTLDRGQSANLTVSWQKVGTLPYA